MAAQQKTEKVAVLGGGPAAIAAAFELTDPALNGRYEVTLLQTGWRLGGKCASGRNMEFERGKRIEEHGLHVWFGFYENSLRLMRRAYDELKRPAGSPLRTFDDAFKHCSETVLYDEQNGKWVALPMVAPENSRVPGEANALPGFWDLAKWLCEWALREYRAMPNGSPQPPTGASLSGPTDELWNRLVFDDEVDKPNGAVENGLEMALALAKRAQATGTELLPREDLPTPEPLPVMAAGIGGPVELVFVELLCKFRDGLWDIAHQLFEDDPHWRAFFSIFDTFVSAAAGVVKEDVLEKGWEAVNQYDLCEWLKKHDAKPTTLGTSPADRAPLLRSIYDVAFGYPDGDIDSANVAAGTAINDLLRLAFNYAGSIMYKMQAGMGDTVLTPFYEVLKERKGPDGKNLVDFRFFSCVTDLHLSAGHTEVQSIDYVEQVDLLGEGYKPTFPVNKLECWPSEPLWSRIHEGDTLRKLKPDFEGEADPLGRGAAGAKTLELGTDFDHVVLAIPVGALGPICKEVEEHSPDFKTMLESAVTVRTQAFQVWLTETPKELGWTQSQNSVAGCYTEPIDTWCDMTHLLEREEWPESAGVKGLAYFCGVLDHRQETPAEALERVKDNAEDFLDNHIGPLWPKVLKSGGKGMEWNFLANPGKNEMPGPGRLNAQYFRANTRGSELYVLTPKGTVKDRLAADQSGITNLFLAGDWTSNGIDGGCVEAAMASGVQAARAIKGVEEELAGQSDMWLASRRPGGPSMPAPPARREPNGTGPFHQHFSSAQAEPANEPDAGRPSAPTTGGSPMTPLPDYIEYGGRATAPPPFLSTEGNFRSFLVHGDEQKIADLVERVYNVPAEGKVVYKPMFGKHLLLQAGAFKKVSSQAPGFENWGYVDEAQISVWIPVEAGRMENGDFIGERIGMCVPYILVNNPMSYAGGREIYGYPKTLGIFDPPTSVGDPLTVQAFGGQFSPQSEAGWHRLFELRRTGTPPAPGPAVSDAWVSSEEAGETVPLFGAELIDLFPEWSLLESIWRALTGKESIQVFLKQFRDAELAGKACYRTIVEGPIEYLNTKTRPSLDEWELVVDHLDSHPIDEELGLTTQTTRISFEGTMDFIAKAGTVVAP
jgi:uncharacterized protein with NAD-binding domain and iron-sulfur cluster